MSSFPTPASFSCPLPYQDDRRISLVYGGGGRLLNQLISDVFLKNFGDTDPASLHDSAVLESPGRRLAFTTDSFVVNPLFFPGGDIGSLAVHGTVNDLSMSGARPLYLSAAFIIEEGLEIAVLEKIARSMGEAARLAGVRIVTGDTKVVEKGRGDGLYINTAGVGVVEHDGVIAPSRVREGDAILVSGDLGRHGIAVMSLRDGLEFGTELESDSAPLNDSVAALLAAGLPVHCLRDVTRGGLTTTLNEIAESCGKTLALEERDIPLCEAVDSACGLLGLDPLQAACEGRYIVILPEERAEEALRIMRSVPVSSGACRIGRVEASGAAPLLMKGRWGTTRILSMPTGAQLPRIC